MTKIFNYTMQSTIENICCAAQTIISNLQNCYENIDEDTLFEIKVILNELFCNAVRHGNKEISRKIVKITYGISKCNFMFLIVEDEGEGYDYRRYIYSDIDDIRCSEISDMKETGRGLLIVKNLCDKIKFNDKGNKIVILKKL